MISKTDLFFPISDDLTDWTGFTVVVPSVSVGNVPQLAVDLLISTLLQQNEARLVGRIRSPCLRPFAGPNPYDIFSTRPSSSCEVYVSSAHKLVLLQLRTPPYAETRHVLSRTLSSWIRGQNFGPVVILSSSFSQCLTEPDLDASGETIKFLLSQSASESEPLLLLNGVRAHAAIGQAGVVRIPGSGFGYGLFQQLKDEGHNVVLLVLYCSEGDNRPEALSLVRVVGSALLGMGAVTWSEPVSWKNMFGADIRSDIF